MKRKRLRLWALVLALFSCAASCSNFEKQPARDVSGEMQLRFDETTWLCTHNSYNASESGFRFTNQTHSIEKQLKDGVRALMLDVWLQDGEVVLRHGDVATVLLGSKPLTEELTVIRDFLTDNNQAIVTLIFESHVAPELVEEAFDQSGLVNFCHIQEEGRSWPTLQQMRENNRRLVVFSDRAGDSDWHMPVWDHCLETDWNTKATQDLLNNKRGRGADSNSLFIVNHFVNSITKQKHAREANSSQFLNERFGPESKLQRRPNFIVVDFYEEGDCLKSVSALNLQPIDSKCP